MMRFSAGESSFAAGREQLIVRDLQEHLVENGSGDFLETLFGVRHHDLENDPPKLVSEGQRHLAWNARTTNEHVNKIDDNTSAYNI